MFELSDQSQVNPEQLVEDIDSLDNNLLNSSFKRNNSTTNFNSSISLPSDGKKKVMFKDYNEDDPLADLISDEEDFQDEKKSKPTYNTKSNLIQNLFGIKTLPNSTSSTKLTERQVDLPDVKENANDQGDLSSNQDKRSNLKNDSTTFSKNKSHIQKDVQSGQSVPRETATITEKFPDKSKLLDNAAQKSSLMQDLFGNWQRSTSAKSTYLDSEPTKAKIGTLPIADVLKPEQSSKSHDGRYAPTISTSRDTSRRRRGSNIVKDPLSLLTTPSSSDRAPELKPHRSMPVEESKNKLITDKDLPEWLGGAKDTSDKKKVESIEEPLPSTSQSNRQEKEFSSIEDTQIRQDNYNEVPTTIELSHVEYPKSNELSPLLSAQFDQHAAIMRLQQQEHELRTAVNLSQQNEQLNKLVSSQKSQLNEQEQQFNMLIKKQIERQALLEAQMKAQQDRINYYVQMLMAQPTSVPASFPTDNLEDKNKTLDNKETELEGLVKKLELEKLCLENALSSLTQKHEYEIQIHEESYKRQISTLQEAEQKLEKRSSHELRCLETDYEEKITRLKQEKLEMEDNYKKEIENIKKEQAQFINDIYERHTHNVKLLQKEHVEVLENITKAKQSENLALSAITSHKIDMEHMLQKANTIITSTKNLYETIKKRNEKTEESRENYLKTQEETLQVQRQELQEQNEKLEKERNKIVEIVQKVEFHITNLMLEFQKKSTQYTEMEERLKVREQALVEEKKLFEEKVIWERKHLQVLKEIWNKEHERQLKIFAEEKETIAAERAKLEVLNQLKNTSDDLEKIEVNAAIKTARTANNHANQEKLRWQKKINELEMQEYHYQEREKQLILRAKELENFTQLALEKKEEGLRALKQAQHIESQHKGRLSQLQMQLEALAQREDKVATDKINLSRERLALRIFQAEKPEKDIQPSVPICTKDPSYVSKIQNSAWITPHSLDIVDPQLLMLKLNLDNQLDISNKCLATMGI